MSRRIVPRLLLAVLAAAACAAPAAGGELDGLALLSWAADAETDTLVLAAAASRDLWLLVRADLAPARFVETTGDWHFDEGLTITGFEVLTTGTPVGAIDLGEHGLATVRVGDFDCGRGGDPYAVARLTVAIDPARFTDGQAAVTPVPGSTRLAFADYDPVMHCVGVWDIALIEPLVVLDPALPAAPVGFGALKARYR